MGGGAGERRFRAFEGALALLVGLVLLRGLRRAAKRPGPPFSRVAARRVRMAVAFIIAVLVAGPTLAMVAARTPPATGQHRRPDQPMWFDHRHHAAGFGIPCTYCHAGADKGAMAGLPAADACVPCHNAAWLRTPAFAPVRQSIATGKPIAWRRANVLPDFVYFDHAAHVTHGVACDACHGDVSTMAKVEQAKSLTMGFCLDCHRARSATVGAWLTDCTTCHR